MAVYWPECGTGQPATMGSEVLRAGVCCDCSRCKEVAVCQ